MHTWNRRYGAAVSILRLPDRQTLVEYDATLAARLSKLLVDTLQDELGEPEREAVRLASEVGWTVTRELDGAWLKLTHGTDTALGVGGNWQRDEDGLTLYVRQLAYELAGRASDFEP